MPLNILNDEFPKSVFLSKYYYLIYYALFLLVNEENVRNALNKMTFTIPECSNIE